MAERSERRGQYCPYLTRWVFKLRQCRIIAQLLRRASMAEGCARFVWRSGPPPLANVMTVTCLIPSASETEFLERKAGQSKKDDSRERR